MNKKELLALMTANLVDMRDVAQLEGSKELEKYINLRIGMAAKIAKELDILKKE